MGVSELWRQLAQYCKGVSLMVQNVSGLNLQIVWVYRQNLFPNDAHISVSLTTQEWISSVLCGHIIDGHIVENDICPHGIACARNLPVYRFDGGGTSCGVETKDQ